MPFLLFSLTVLQRKQTNEKPFLVRLPEILLRANFAGVRHAWVNNPIKAEYSNLWWTCWAAQPPFRLAPCLNHIFGCNEGKIFVFGGGGGGKQSFLSKQIFLFFAQGGGKKYVFLLLEHILKLTEDQTFLLLEYWFLKGSFHLSFISIQRWKLVMADNQFLGA